MIDRWLVASLVLLLCGAGCAGTLVDRAQSAENVLRDVAAAAHEQLKPQCDAAVDNAPSREKAEAIKATCVKAEKAYGVFVAAWLELDDAIAEARLAGQDSPDLSGLIANMEKAARDFLAVVKAVQEL